MPVVSDPCPGPWIVVPTYDEAEALPELANRLLPILRRAIGRDAFRVLVVDDASPDGTGAIAEHIAAAEPEVRVLHRPGKEGLGRAYVDGFATALAGGATTVVQMDADGSHDPAAVPSLLEATDRGVDLAIGSRYVDGGATPDWCWSRRLLSRGGCAYARAVLGVGIRDLTGGFKAWRRDALQAVDPATAQGAGYVFQVELTYRALRLGRTVREVPIVFRDRTAGQSKMGSAIVREALIRVPRLRLAGRVPAAVSAAAGAQAHAQAGRP